MEAVIGLLGGGHEIPWVRQKCHKYYSGSLVSIFWGGRRVMREGLRLSPLLK